MKILRTGIGALAAAACILTTGLANAQNLLTNGSFEAGVAGWTLTETAPGDCVFQSLSPPSNTVGAGGFPTQPPTRGAFTLMSDANAPSTCTFFQDVVVPTAFNRLSYAAGYNYFDFLDPAAPGCAANVSVTTTGGVPIAVGYTATGGVNQPMAVRPVLSFTVAPGSTVRVIITTISCASGPVGIVADNFVLAAAAGAQVPTLSEWAMLLLALLMAGGALFTLRSKKA